MLDDSSSVLTSSNTGRPKSNEANIFLSDDKLFNEDELDQNELLGINDYEDDFELLGGVDEKKQPEYVVEKKIIESIIEAKESETKKEDAKEDAVKNEKTEISKLEIPEKTQKVFERKELKQEAKQKFKHDMKQDFTVEKNEVNQKPKLNKYFKLMSPQKQQRQTFNNQNFTNRNNGILPTPTNFTNQNYSIQNIAQSNPIMFQTQRPQHMSSFGQSVSFQQAPVNQFPFFNQPQNFQNYQQHDQMTQIPINQFQTPNFAMPLQQPIIPNQMIPPLQSQPQQFNQSQFVPMGFNQPPIIPQPLTAPKTSNVYINPSFIAKQQQKREEAKKEDKSAKRKDLDLLLEKRLAAELENEKLVEEQEKEKNKQKESNKRKSNETELMPKKISKTENKRPETETTVLSEDVEYIKKIEEQKKKREEILRQKEEKRNQRIKQLNSEKNENLPVTNEQKSRTVIATRESLAATSDNRIIKTTSNSIGFQSKRLIVQNLSLNTNDKKLLNMCNSISLKDKVNNLSVTA